MNTGFVLMTLLAHSVPHTADLRAYLGAVRDRLPEAEICVLTGPALDYYDALIDRGHDDASIVRSLGDLADPRRPSDVRARLIETMVACEEAD